MSHRPPLAAVAVVAALFAFAAPANAATIVVDDDAVECPNADAATVQAGVDAAAVGDTVAICPGTYREGGGPLDRNGVRIAKPLTIKGAGADRVRIEPNADIRETAPADARYEPADGQGNVIVVAGTPGPVAISGVTVAGGNASDPRGAEVGIVFANASGSVSRSRVTDLVPADTSDFSSNVGYGVVAFGVDDRPGGYSISLSRVVLDGYAKGGVRIGAIDDDTKLAATVSDSVLRGRGPLSGSGQGQNGIQLRGPGASATIERNSIVDHRYLPDESGSVGVLLFDADAAGTTIRDNDFRGNGYGVFNADDELCDATDAVPAPSNWWGHPDGPTVDYSSSQDCPPATYEPTGDPAEGNRVNGDAVDFDGEGDAADQPDPAAHGAPVAPGAEPDQLPDVDLTAPSADAVVAPSGTVAVAATAEDDFDVRRVDFVRNGTVVATDAEPPYAANLQPPAAGASIAVTALAYDSAGQSAADSVSVRGRAATTPTQQRPEDRPPTVSFTSPAPFTSIDPRAVPPLTANASDDDGVARVVFLDDGRPVCTDTSAPYTCAYAPTGDDVGRNTLIAIAQDRAGQTAADFRPVRLGRFQPRVTAKTTPKRDRRRPYRYRTKGRLVLPAGVTPAQACASGGTVQVQLAAGRLRLPLIGVLRPDCSFRTSIVFPSRRPLGKRGRLTVTTRFDGNDVLGAARAKKQRVRAG